MSENTMDVEYMKERLKTEYEEFTRNRKRWKGDFKEATNKTERAFDRVDDLVN